MKPLIDLSKLGLKPTAEQEAYLAHRIALGHIMQRVAYVILGRDMAARRNPRTYMQSEKIAARAKGKRQRAARKLNRSAK